MSVVRRRRVRMLLFLLALIGASPLNAATEYEKVLQDAGVGTDAAALLTFFRQRTPNDADREQMKAWVRQLGSDQYRLREDASRQLIQRGPPARTLLGRARRDPDAEIARRAALCLEEIDSGPGPALPAAAIHVLTQLRPAGATAALLAYLPFAEDEGVEEEIRAALVNLTPDSGPFDAALTKAVADAHPLVRAAAAHVLGRNRDATRRALVRPLLRDPDATVRWRTARALLLARDKDGVTTLIQLLEDAPPEVAARAEESLYLLAGEQAPAVSRDDAGTGNRRECRDAWQTWWQRHGDSVDWARVADDRPLLDLTLGIEFNTGRVWECGRGGKRRWELTGLAGPMEAQVLPGNRVLVAESHAHSVSERDFTGKVLWQKKIGGDPTGCQRLPNGNTFVSTYGSVMEFTRDGREVYSFKLPAGSNAIRKHRNGHILFVGNNEIVEVDTAGNKVRTIALPAAADVRGHSGSSRRSLPGCQLVERPGAGSGRQGPNLVAGPGGRRLRCVADADRHHAGGDERPRRRAGPSRREGVGGGEQGLRAARTPALSLSVGFNPLEPIRITW